MTIQAKDAASRAAVERSADGVVWAGGPGRAGDVALMLRAAEERRPATGEGRVEFAWIDNVVTANWRDGKAFVSARLYFDK